MIGRISGQVGSTLIEVLIAMLVLVSGVFAMAQLLVIAAATNAAARQTTITATLAAQKVEQMLSTAMTVVPESVEHVDSFGRVLSHDASPPPNAVYTRRWSIESLTADSVVLRVRVGASDRADRQRRMSGETQMLTIRRRTEP